MNKKQDRTFVGQRDAPGCGMSSVAVNIDDQSIILGSSSAPLV